MDLTPDERPIWDVDPDAWPHTPPLRVFRVLMDEDDNTWWRAGSGHGLNAYEAAIEAIERVEAVCRRWDVTTKGVSPTTRTIYAAIEGLPGDARERTEDEDIPTDAELQAAEGAVPGGNTRTPAEWPGRQPTSPQRPEPGGRPDWLEMH